ncbi:hypothetical protein K2173_016793 [Erythroxylum novogranatense]|uniref:Homeobox domain-containing protein n=1 Tax=Erythroxylum novogranatense TaxID=1862640 RepID=A0AAV8SH82_9ROSI|nr:hypothetical protein K2173_016793 [Erythroxylum novogranatense]
MSPSTSSRWCPTPEQLMILEELYRSGIRTPHASQIQRITAHLSLYGKIEGKNVFYWFQNHKARDRQKLRRKLIKQLQQQQPYHHHHHHLEQPQHIPSNYHLFNYFDHPPTPISGEIEVAPQVISHNWKPEIPSRFKMESPTMRMCSHDWMMSMVDIGLPSPCCNRPLKTLELFPMTATNVKEEHTNTSSKHLSLPTPTN